MGRDIAEWKFGGEVLWCKAAFGRGGVCGSHDCCARPRWSGHCLHGAVQPGERQGHFVRWHVLEGQLLSRCRPAGRADGSNRARAISMELARVSQLAPDVTSIGLNSISVDADALDPRPLPPTDTTSSLGTREGGTNPPGRSTWTTRTWSGVTSPRSSIGLPPSPQPSSMPPGDPVVGMTGFSYGGWIQLSRPYSITAWRRSSQTCRGTPRLTAYTQTR